MGKQGSVRIDPRLCAVFRHVCLREHIAVPVSDIPADYFLRERVLPLVIRAVDKCIRPRDREIDQISHERDEQDHKEIRDPCKLLISRALAAFCASSAWGLPRISVRSPPLFGALFFPCHFLISFLS